MLTELKGMGDCRIFCKTENIPRLIELDPQQSYMEWNITLTTAESAEAVRDVFIFVDGRCELDIKISESDSEPEASADENPGGKNYGAGIQGPDKTRPAPVIRVRAEKLDTLVDLVGELVTVQASLSSKASIFNDSEMVSIAEAVERLTADLRDTAMSIRMVPISTLFVKFRRLVHDLSQEMGKEVVMTTRGGDTELDKTVIDRLNDPLIHIIRNSIDHGIELPTVRAEFRKPVRGNIHMCAEHAADSVLIRISDDGAGLDRAAIFQKAVERELVPADAELTDKEMFSFIFLPGFSTREEISAVSGRGVGMDVVKNSIENLRGTIEIDSERGQGTVITLKLPLTLAIIDGLLVEVDRSFYVFPLSTVEECMEFSPDDLQMNADRDLIIVRGELVPYIFLRKLFRIQNPAPGVEHIVIIRLNHMRVGFVVDDIIGEHQTVIKTMGRLYKNARMFSGSTILADGSVALILDPYRLFEAAEAEERGEMEEDALWL
jgi:two-component system chemotaxis sensor kinase CheA